MVQKTNTNFLYGIGLTALAACLAALLALMLPAQPAQAQVNECSTLPSDRGLATTTESGVDAGTYAIWARVKVNSGPATFRMSIDGAGGSACNFQMSGANSNGNWVWTQHSASLNWTGGDMRFQMSGDKDGVGLDCVVLHSGSFDPTNLGAEGCAPAAGDDGTGDDGSGCDAVDYDVNGNGSITSQDAFATYNRIDSTTPDDLCQYDVNRNGNITSQDAFAVYNRIQ